MVATKVHATLLSLNRRDNRGAIADEICGRLFKDGKKEDGPTLFPWNQEVYFNFKDPTRL